MSFGIATVFIKTRSLDHWTAKQRFMLGCGTALFDLGLFIAALTLGSLAAQGKVFSAKQCTGATVGFFVAAGVLPAMDFAAQWFPRRVHEGEEEDLSSTTSEGMTTASDGEEGYEKLPPPPR